MFYHHHASILKIWISFYSRDKEVKQTSSFAQTPCVPGLKQSKSEKCYRMLSTSEKVFIGEKGSFSYVECEWIGNMLQETYMMRCMETRNTNCFFLNRCNTFPVAWFSIQYDCDVTKIIDEPIKANEQDQTSIWMVLSILIIILYYFFASCRIRVHQRFYQDGQRNVFSLSHGETGFCRGWGMVNLD